MWTFGKNEQKILPNVNIRQVFHILQAIFAYCWHITYQNVIKLPRRVKIVNKLARRVRVRRNYLAGLERKDIELFWPNWHTGSPPPLKEDPLKKFFKRFTDDFEQNNE